MYKINKVEEEAKKVHKIVKTICIFLYIIIIPIIVINFSLIIKSFINPNEIPDIFGYKPFIIVSRSMEPTINKNDAIFIKEVPKSSLQVNDIIAFQDSGSIVTHRIVAIEEDDGIVKYQTKGDNNTKRDKKKVTYDEIEGEYQFKINGLGVILNIIQSKITLIILIVIVVFHYFYQKRLKKKKEQRSRKREEYANSRR